MPSGLLARLRDFEADLPAAGGNPSPRAYIIWLPGQRYHRIVQRTVSESIVRFVVVPLLEGFLPPCYPRWVGKEEGRQASPLGRWAGSFLKIGVSALAVWLIAQQVEFEELRDIVTQADAWAVFGVLAIYLFGQALTAWRWHYIAGRVGFDHGLLEVARFYYIGMFFNLFGPSTLGGDVVRSLYLGERDGRRMVALNTVLFDRITGLAMLVFVAMVSFAIFGRYDLPWGVVGLSFGLGLGLLGGWWLVPILVRKVFKPQHRVRVLVERDLGPFWNDRALLWRTSWLSVAFHIVQVLSLLVLAEAVGMEGVPWPYFFIFHPLVTIASALPISMAGLGVREMGYLWFLERQGVDHHFAVAFGLGWFAVLMASSLVGGIVYLASGQGMPTAKGPRESANPST